MVPSWVEEGEGERGGAIVRRKRERGGAIMGRRGREGEGERGGPIMGWCHRG